MHFPYDFLAKNQWFEKLTKGTALGGLSLPNYLPMSIKNPTAKHFLGRIEKRVKKVLVLIVF